MKFLNYLAIICAISMSHMVSAEPLIIAPNQWVMLAPPTNGDPELALAMAEQLKDPGIISPSMWYYTNNSYVNLNTLSIQELSEVLVQPAGFWFKHKGIGPIELQEAAEPPEGGTQQCTAEFACSGFFLTLGWNQIGNNFDEFMDTGATFMFSHETVAVCNPSCTYAVAIEAGLVSSPLWAWDGTAYVDIYQSSIHPWEGAWMRALMEGVGFAIVNPYCVGEPIESSSADIDANILEMIGYNDIELDQFGYPVEILVLYDDFEVYDQSFDEPDLLAYIGDDRQPDEVFN